MTESASWREGVVSICFLWTPSDPWQNVEVSSSESRGVTGWKPVDPSEQDLCPEPGVFSQAPQGYHFQAGWRERGGILRNKSADLIILPCEGLALRLAFRACVQSLCGRHSNGTPRYLFPFNLKPLTITWGKLYWFLLCSQCPLRYYFAQFWNLLSVSTASGPRLPGFEARLSHKTLTLSLPRWRWECFWFLPHGDVVRHLWVGHKRRLQPSDLINIVCV